MKSEGVLEQSLRTIYGSIKVEEDWKKYIMRSLIFMLHIIWL
jgi:hypothetical protein